MTTTSSLTADQRASIRARLHQAPAAMTLQLAAELQVPEVEIIRNMPDDRAVELDIARWQQIFEELPEFGKVHVIVSNGAATLEAEGEFGNFSTWGEFFNVQTSSLDMHIRYKNLAAAFAVEKPSHMTGVATLSIHFYDQAGQCALKVFPAFGNQAASPELRQRFDALRAKYRLSPASR